jgi:hypothetical protein
MRYQRTAISYEGLYRQSDRRRTAFCGCLTKRRYTQVVQESSLHLGREGMVGELVLAFALDLIIGPVQMLNFWRPGQEAFLSAPTEVMLLPLCFRCLYLKNRTFMWVIAIQGNSSIHSRLLLSSQAGEVGQFPYQCRPGVSIYMISHLLRTSDFAPTYSSLSVPASLRLSSLLLNKALLTYFPLYP